MLSFILIAGLITLFTVLALVWPLLKKQSSRSYEREAQNIHFAKERLSELDDQLANKTISPDDYQSLKLEIESTLALDIDYTESKTISHAEPEKTNGLVIALICLSLPLSGLLIYKYTGTPAGLNAQISPQATLTDDGTRVPDVATMVKSLEDKLEINPENLEGWIMLARSYQALGRFQNALDAYTKVIQLGGDNPDIYAAMADVSALNANGLLAGQPQEYVNKALQLQDAHPQALWLAGLGAAQSGNNGLAREYWNKLIPQLANAPQQQQELQEIIDQSFEFSGQAIKPRNESNRVNENSNNDLDSGDEYSAGPNIRVEVSISSELDNLIEGNDVVFVFAKAKQGPPAPLAVKKLKVADLPTTIVLSDSDAMMEQLQLSRFTDVIVSARITKSGNPIAQPGDFQSELVDTKTNSADTISLRISQLIE